MVWESFLPPIKSSWWWPADADTRSQEAGSTGDHDADQSSGNPKGKPGYLCFVSLCCGSILSDVLGHKLCLEILKIKIIEWHKNNREVDILWAKKCASFNQEDLGNERKLSACFLLGVLLTLSVRLNRTEVELVLKNPPFTKEVGKNYVLFLLFLNCFY